MTKILLTTLGSYGDLNPYLGMGRVLKKNGYEVVLCTHANYREPVEKLGLKFVELKPSLEELGPEDEWSNHVNHPRTGIEFILKKILSPYIKHNYEIILKESEGCSLIISHLLTIITPLVAEKKQIPYLSCILQPSTFLSSYEPPILGPLPFLPKLKFLGPSFFDFLYSIMEKSSNSWFKDLKKFRKEIGLTTKMENPLVKNFSSHGTLALFDKDFGEPQKDWPEKTFQVGFPLFDEEKEVELSLETQKFLENGEKPIVFTLGTAIVLTKNNFFETAYRAVKKSGHRAIFLVGKNAKPIHGYILKDEKIHVSPYEPFSKLFSQAKIIVHQCGVGTTAQALFSGKPQILVPFAHDQPDNAKIVIEKGIGITINAQKLNENNLFEAIKLIDSNENYAKKSLEFSKKMSLTSFEEEFLKAIKNFI